MASDYKDIAVTAYDTLRFSWWERANGQSIANNTTIVDWGLYLISTTYGAIYSNPLREWNVDVNGNKYSGSVSVAIGNNETKTLASGSTTIPHNADGSKTFSYSFSQVFNITFSDVWRGTYSGSGTGTLTSIPRAATLTSAQDITDESNSSYVRFTNPAGNALDELWLCIGDTNWNVIIPYQQITNKTADSFTYTINDEGKKLLRKAAPSTSSRIRYYLRSTIGGVDHFTTLDRTLTIVNGDPVISVALSDGNPKASAITGNSTTFIKDYSTIQYEITATPKKEATIKSYLAKYGSVQKTTATGTFDVISADTLEFSITDSRDVTVGYNTPITLIDYYKPTCKQDVSIALEGETEAKVSVVISGKYFNKSLGTINNTLDLYIRHTDNDGVMGDWINLKDIAVEVTVQSDGTYEADFEVSNLRYDKAYTFQSRVVDKLEDISTNEYAIRLIPVFDWGENDFNFNVPVSIQGGKVYGAYVLAEGSNDGIVNLNDKVSNYDYLEIYFTDNNGVYGGYSKIPTNGTNTINISLSIIEASSMNATYIRRTTYVLRGNTLSPNTTSAGYHSLSQGTVSSSNNSTNYIKILKVVGYK